MIPIPHFFKLLSYLFIITFMFSVGSRTPDLKQVLKKGNHHRILKILFANIILVPLAALIILHFFHLPHDIALGFILIALTPGGLFGLHFAHLSRGDIVYALALALLLTLAAIIVVPFSASLILPLTVSSKMIDLKFIGELILFAFTPLLLGQWMNKHWPQQSKKIGNIASYVSIAMYAGQEWVGTQLKDMSLDSVGHETLLAFILLVLACWIIGWLMAGPDIQQKKVLAIDTSMRNVTICWLMVHRSFADTNVIFALLAFNGIVTPMNFIFGFATRFLGKKEES